MIVPLYPGSTAQGWISEYHSSRNSRLVYIYSLSIYLTLLTSKLKVPQGYLILRFMLYPRSPGSTAQSWISDYHCSRNCIVLYVLVSLYSTFIFFQITICYLNINSVQPSYSFFHFFPKPPQVNLNLRFLVYQKPLFTIFPRCSPKLPQGYLILSFPLTRSSQGSAAQGWLLVSHSSRINCM